jgi:hypothetical protein
VGGPPNARATAAAWSADSAGGREHVDVDPQVACVAARRGAVPPPSVACGHAPCAVLGVYQPPAGEGEDGGGGGVSAGGGVCWRDCA